MNVNVKVAEFDSVPESKETGPLVLVAVCENESWFVQVMLSPTWIVTVLGEKAMPWIFTEWSVDWSPSASTS